jgi:cyclopropane fatty-acyl-phospholipid synthase-like methyltransferase
MNRESYNAIASSWDAARVGFYGRERHYVDTLIKGLPAGAKVLDLGCGTGRPIAEYILAAGHALTGIDQSEALLALARERFPQATWIHSPIESFSTEESFHAIVCWDALFHLDRGMHESLLRRFSAMLLPGGRMMLTCGGSEHPAFTDTMFGQPFRYDSHPPATVLKILSGLGFEPLVSEFMNPPTSGRDKGRYALVVQAVLIGG